MRRRDVCGAAAVACALSAALVACTSTVNGQGTGAPSTPVSSSGSAESTGASTSVVDGSGFRPPPPVTSSSSSTPPAPRPRPEARVTFRGSTTGRTYHALLWDSDTITDCAAHAYGAAMLAFLRAHPCRPTHRILATVDLDGRQVAISSIVTSFQTTGPNIYAAAGQFKKLELANGTGSIDDLLREGGSVAGRTGSIPPHEAFTVLAQDTGVDVLDAWYLNGSTPDQDPALLRLLTDVFLSKLMTAH